MDQGSYLLQATAIFIIKTRAFTKKAILMARLRDRQFVSTLKLVSLLAILLSLHHATEFPH